MQLCVHIYRYIIIFSQRHVYKKRRLVPFNQAKTRFERRNPRRSLVLRISVFFLFLWHYDTILSHPLTLAPFIQPFSTYFFCFCKNFFTRLSLASYLVCSPLHALHTTTLAFFFSSYFLTAFVHFFLSFCFAHVSRLLKI